MPELTDAEVFGTNELSDADVFGQSVELTDDEVFGGPDARQAESLGPSAGGADAIPASTVKTELSAYETELNKEFQRVSKEIPLSDFDQGAINALQSGVKSAQQIAPTIIGSQVQQLKTGQGFDPPESVKRKAYEDIYGESFKGQIEKLDRSQDPDAKSDALYAAYEQRVHDLTQKRNAMLDIWSGVAEDLQREKSDIPKTQAQQELAQAKTQRDKWSVFRKYPLQVTSSIVLESLPSSIAGAVLGAPAGPAGVAVGVGLGGASAEYASTLLGEASSAGFDVSKPGGLVAFLDSPAYDAAADKALVRSGIIGGVDMATAGTAGALIKPALKQGLLRTAAAVGAESAVQAVGGAGGELAAQAATRKPGEEYDWFDISMEAVGEAVSATPEAAIRIASEGFKADPVATQAAANGAPATAVAVQQSSEILKPSTEGGVVPETQIEKVQEGVLDPSAAAEPALGEAAAIPSTEAVKGLPPVPDGHTRLFHGEGGPQGGGTGGANYAASIEKASTFGPDISWVDVPHDRLQAAFNKGKASPNGGGDVFILEVEDINRSQKLEQKVETPVFVLDEGINTGALGEVGMGGAKPGEFIPSGGRATGIKNAAVDAERQARGQPPIMATQRLANAVVWDRVMARIDIEPGWQEMLIQDLQNNPRTPNQDEILALDHRYADLQNEYAKATRDGARAFADDYQVGVDQAKASAAFYESKLNELEQIARKVGTEWGRSGQMRQRLLNEDFSLAAMESRMRAAKGFEPLTDAEHSEIADLQAKIAEKEAASAEAEQRFQERISAAELAKAVAEAKAEAAKAPEYEPRVLQVAEKFAKFMDKIGDSALARIKERMGRVSAGVDPTILADVAILGAAKITRGVVDFAKWTDSMTRDLGDWFREHSQEAWDESQKVFSKELDGFFKKGSEKSTTEKVKRAVTDIPGRISDLTESIKKKSSEGEGSPVHSAVRKLVRLLVEQNPDISRDALIDAVHAILQESNPETTRIEAMDAISGRGKFWTPPQDQVSKTVRDLSTQIRLVAHQMDVEAKKPLPRTGYQPEKLSDAARQEQQKLNELKRKYGVVVTNPEAQLGSVLAARKTYYTNRISDLQQEISTRERIVKTKSPSPTDAALEALKAEYEQVRKEHAEIFEKPELNDEQRLKMALSAAERNEARWNERLSDAKRGNFDTNKEPGRKVTSPELEAIKARTESVKEEVQELKDIAFPKKTPDEIALQSLKTRLAREKADLQERLAKGDFSPRRKVRELPLDSEAARAKAEVILLRDKFEAELQKQRYLQKTRAEKIWLGTKEALNLSRAILTSWDVSAVGRQGAFIALGNPIRAAKSMGPMFKSLVSKEAAAAAEAEIQSRPNAKLYEQSGLFLAPREGGKLTGMEEAFMSRLASKIPGVANSARAYVTFLNKLRADSFDALYESLVSSGEATPAELKAIANYVNIATGRGNLGKAAGAAETLSTAFFAPRLVASRFQLIAGEPLYRGSARTRYLVAKEYGKFLVGLGVIYSLGMLAGGDVEDDPRSSNFGKIKFGNTRIDPMAGLSQTTVLASRLATGELKNFRGKVEPIRGDVEYVHRTAADVIATFLRSKLSPIVGNAVDIASGKNVVGEKVTPGSVAVNMTVPLAFRDIQAIMEEQGIPAGVAIGLLSMFGMGVQNYDERQKR